MFTKQELSLIENSQHTIKSAFIDNEHKCFIGLKKHWVSNFQMKTNVLWTLYTVDILVPMYTKLIISKK